VVNYETPETDYTMSMSVEDSYGTCGPWDMYDLRKLLLGSGQMWRSTCKKTLPHVFIIEPNVDYTGLECMVTYLTFKLKYVKKVEVYVDDVEIYSVRCRIWTSRYFLIMLCSRFSFITIQAGCQDIGLGPGTCV